MRELIPQNISKIQNQTLQQLKENAFNFSNEGSRLDAIYVDLQRGVTVNGKSFQGMDPIAIKQNLQHVLTPTQLSQLERAYVQDLAGIFPNLVATGLTPHRLQKRGIYLFGQQDRLFERSLDIKVLPQGIVAVLHGISPVGFRFTSDFEKEPLNLDVECYLKFSLSEQGFTLNKIQTLGQHDLVAARLITGEFDWFNENDAKSFPHKSKEALKEFIELKESEVKSDALLREQFILQSIKQLLPTQLDQHYLTSLQNFLLVDPAEWLNSEFLDKCDYQIKAAVFHGGVNYALYKLSSQMFGYFNYYKPREYILKQLSAYVEKNPDYVVHMSGDQLHDLVVSLFDILREEILLRCFTRKQRFSITNLHANHMKDINQSVLYGLGQSTTNFVKSKPYVPIDLLMDEIIDMSNQLTQQSDLESNIDLDDYILKVNKIIRKPYQDYLGKDRVEFSKYPEPLKVLIVNAFSKDLLSALKYEFQNDEVLGFKDTAALKMSKIEFITEIIGYLMEHGSLPKKSFFDGLRMRYSRDVTDPGTLSQRVSSLLDSLESLAKDDSHEVRMEEQSPFVYSPSFQFN